jgi:hypothetical protein
MTNTTKNVNEEYLRENEASRMFLLLAHTFEYAVGMI